MGAGDALNESQPEPQPPEATGRGRVALAEVVEDGLDPFSEDADALVSDGDPNPAGAHIVHHRG